MESIFVYMTAADDAEAEKIGRALVEARLAACVNMIPGMRAVYWWQGKVESGGETVLIAKTRRSLLDALTAKVRQLHSYQVPCVVALPIAGGNPDFLNWLEKETIS
ncbi:MAG: divalent-cation tolerance protein CutA [Desulfovibrionaceae bacterium]|nr:divalent-cation tolerance protein CutA [Desulfovibrionaceae bacterium]